MSALHLSLSLHTVCLIPAVTDKAHSAKILKLYVFKETELSRLQLCTFEKEPILLWSAKFFVNFFSTVHLEIKIGGQKLEISPRILRPPTVIWNATEVPQSKAKV